MGERMQDIAKAMILAGMAATVSAQAAAESVTVQIGKFTLPLPPGEFRLIFSTTTTTTASVPIARAVYGQLHDGRVSSLVVLSSNISPIAGSWTREPSICERNDVYFAFADRNFDRKNGDCWIVDFFATQVGQNGTEYMSKGLGWARSQGASGVMVGTAAFVSRGSYYIAARYYFNPDLAGIAPLPASVRRAANPWRVESYREDPAKADFYAKLQVFGAALHGDMRSSLNGVVHFPTLPPVLPDLSKPVATVAAPSSAETRLRGLKDMAERGLISAEEYEAKKKQILDGL